MAEKYEETLLDTAQLIKKAMVNFKKSPKERLTRGYIEARITNVEDYWGIFKTAHGQLVLTVPSDKRGDIPYFKTEVYQTTEDIYLTYVGCLKDLLYSMKEPQGSSSVQQGVMAGYQPPLRPQVRLPKIQLPVFSGKYDAWPTFQDLFTSLIHNNPSITQVEKLHYLKSSVVGEAQALLKNIQITDNNYELAWKRLKGRYGNKRITVMSIMKTLFHQKKIVNRSALSIKTLLDTTNECLDSLINLKINIDSWDPTITFLVVEKLDSDSRKDWEEYSFREDTEELPTWKDLKKFLETKFRTLEQVPTPMTVCTTNIRERNIKERSYHATMQTNTEKSCIMCNDNHSLSHCNQFKSLNPTQRSDYVKEKRLCFNCLLPGHPVFKCRIRVSCHACRRRHHTLLHEPREVAAEPLKNKTQSSVTAHHQVEEEEEAEDITNTVVASHHISRPRSTALLATAIVKAYSEEGNTIMLRALIDQGSQACFITEKMTQALKLPRQLARGDVTGVGSTKERIKHVVRLRIQSIHEHKEELNIQAYVMPKELTTKIPQRAISIQQNWKHLEGLKLADPSYMLPGSIDLLLGVKEYAQIIHEDLIRGPPGYPCAQNTSLGWILFGEVKTKADEESVVVMHHNVDLDDMLKTLWEVETNDKRVMTKEEKQCEIYYEKTHMRNKEGRYIVKLPFKNESTKVTESDTREIALKRYLQLERRLRRQPKLEREYIKVMKEYLDLGHAEEIPEEELLTKKAVYLPHHPVIREDKDTTKTRIVFDASCKGSSGISLNDELLLGPVLQDDIREIMMRWRMHAIAFVTDIKMMYRMILLNREHVDFQRILWRKEHDKSIDLNNTNEVKDYRLLTVTFGTASAPYLAIKTLMQLTIDEGDNLPIAAKLIREDCYVDDLVSGCDSVEEAITASRELKALTNRGGFQLKKWSSNSIDLMKTIDPEDRSSKTQVHMKIDGIIKALGVVWNLTTDRLEYNVQLPQLGQITKRTILSDIQKLYDPLGWITPSIILAKMLIQKLWTLRVGWDDEVDEYIKEEWLKIRTDLNNVNKISIPRWLDTYSKEMNKIQIHGFCDASMRAYAAVAYIRVEHNNGNITTHLIAAKSRVTPLKTLSIPRLELCGAVLLSRLLKQIVKAMKLSTTQVFAHTDSTIVLAWLAGEPARWKPFIANRVVEIIDNWHISRWFHIVSEENPADVASRGKLLQDLKNDKLWWNGPTWLTEKKLILEHPTNIETSLELKREIQANVVIENNDKRLARQFEDFDNLEELLKCIVYCKKFLNFKKSNNDSMNILTPEEIENALLTCIRIAQEDEFEEDIKYLKKKQYVKKTSTIKTLNPYLDSSGLLKVGGRLKNSTLNEAAKHPLILGNKNKLTHLIVTDAHAKTLHGGIQLMMCYLRSKYWIIKAKTLVKSKIHRCLICARHSATYKNQMMGNLPTMRVSPARPFTNSGVDFAGPILLLSSRGRGMKTKKGYICIFICMATRAIHIELVGDMTSQSFISAFKRFTARRGKCSNLWSDQGRNFIGADKELKYAWKEACLEFDSNMINKIALDGTQWHFIPPYSPHFGGLWEAGVKSIKHHLKRILTKNLTFEEMTTVLCEIESCLNSRPLCPVDDADINSDILTPGHFLIGESPVVVPTPALPNVHISTLSRWQHTQKLVRDFWTKWQQEYLTRLQQRPKWLKKQREFQVGEIVLVRSESMPPGKWPLARVVQKHPGDDNVTRVYSVKCGGNITKCCVTRLCALPINCNDDN